MVEVTIQECGCSTWFEAHGSNCKREAPKTAGLTCHQRLKAQFDTEESIPMNEVTSGFCANCAFRFHAVWGPSAIDHLTMAEAVAQYPCTNVEAPNG